MLPGVTVYAPSRILWVLDEDMGLIVESGGLELADLVSKWFRMVSGVTGRDIPSPSDLDEFGRRTGLLSHSGKVDTYTV